MRDTTVIYVSSNREDPEFEKKIQEDLLDMCGNLPIISVTQKPTKLGTNICVGDVGASGYNFCRQVLIACEAAKTKFVVSAEADCLYSPGYFNFVPKRLDVPYRNTNLYVLKYKQDVFCAKHSSTFSQVIGREFYIKRLKELFKGLPKWDPNMKNFPKEIGKKLFDEFEYFETQYACISFKTGNGMRKHSTTDEIPLSEIPYWGLAKLLRERFL